MSKRSAGLVMYRIREKQLEVFLVHPGGPFWVNKDKGAWAIPKGQVDDGEEALDAARREFQEETGFLAHGEFLELGTIRQLSGKLVDAWAFEGDCDPDKLRSITCEVEWPPRSKRMIEVPEVDRGQWFTINAAHESIIESQRPFLVTLCAALNCDADGRLA
ncbi:MAG TPA: NUDIX domain-containing protein [Candidatus Aquilonibacter sp.]|nr:NUDIX domain-containing protein [Candidatus Aquilonibacter sp.]